MASGAPGRRAGVPRIIATAGSAGGESARITPGEIAAVVAATRRPLRADADPQRLVMSPFAALPGGLLLIQTRQSIEPPGAALDGALAALKSFRN
jgi:hypothetical protein